MCGICGFIDDDPTAAYRPAQVLSAMLDTLVNRGPDDVGRYVQQGVHLGMRRLAVIDLQTGRQPIIDPDSGVVIVYNGEVYNYRALYTELRRRGHEFTTSSDTEVVLKAYLEYRLDFISRLNGMFAFALWDPRRRRLLLGRDRFGQKPLYFYYRNHRLVFGSDLRTLLKHPLVNPTLNHQALSDYLMYRHVPGPDTLIASVTQLPPGHLGILQQTGQTHNRLRLQRYWKPRYRPATGMTLAEASERFADHWKNAVRAHLVSDVPVGAFVSGGIDSSLLVAEAAMHAHELRTYSIGFDDPAFDETVYARQVAERFGCRHRVIPFRESLETLIRLWKTSYDQPFADPASFPLMILAREARPEVTVCLTGDGADELFAGYQRYRSLLATRRLRRLPRLFPAVAGVMLETLAALFPTASHRHRYCQAVGRRLRLVDPDISREYLNQFHTFSVAMLRKLLDKDRRRTRCAAIDADDPLPSVLLYDLQHWLPDQMLVKSDRATMGFSLEARLPFLDNELVDFALSIPSRLHLQPACSKAVLRTACAARLPESICQRRKQGFQIPIDRWLRTESGYITDLIDDGLTGHAGLFDAGYIRSLLAAHLKGRRNHGERLLTLALFFAWSKELIR